MRIPSTTIVPVFKMPGTTLKLTTVGAGQPNHNEKDSTMITAEIPRDTTFQLPEGEFVARIAAIKRMVRQSGDGPQDWVRFLFDVQVPGLSERSDAMAGRNFKLDLNQGSELRNWLTEFLGPVFFKEHAGEPFRLDSLIGIDCVVQLVHFQGTGYKKPLVVVAHIFPAKVARFIKD